MVLSNLESSGKRGMWLYSCYRLFPFSRKKAVTLVGGGRLAALPTCLLEPFLPGSFEKRRMWCREQAKMNEVTLETNNTGSASEGFPKPVTFSSCSLLKPQAGAIKLQATGGCGGEGLERRRVRSIPTQVVSGRQWLLVMANRSAHVGYLPTYSRG